MLEWATAYFSEKGIPSPRLSIEWLLSHVLDIKRLDLYLKFDRPLSPDELDRLKPMILRRAKMEPLQYITGSTDFYNLTLHVNRDVLIPRPETEQLVELILQNHSADEPLDFLDIGTGSGCIALAVKKERPEWNVTAMDNCEKALKVAGENARINGLEITFLHEDFETWRCEKPMDIIASNPPYIEKHEESGLSEQVIAYEPRNALITDSVSEVYRQLYQLCTHCLNPDGAFYFEINETAGHKLLKICNMPPLQSRLVRDYENRDRFILGGFEQNRPKPL